MSNRKSVPIVLIKYEHAGTAFPECQSEFCALKSECANHTTAGDFRLEDGFTPPLLKGGDEWTCEQTYGNSTGPMKMVLSKEDQSCG